MSKNAKHVKAAHQKQLDAGWRRLGLRLNPETARHLDALVRREKKTPTEIISALIREESIYPASDEDE